MRFICGIVLATGLMVGTASADCSNGVCGTGPVRSVVGWVVTEKPVRTMVRNVVACQPVRTTVRQVVVRQPVRSALRRLLGVCR